MLSLLQWQWWGRELLRTRGRLRMRKRLRHPSLLLPFERPLPKVSALTPPPVFVRVGSAFLFIFPYVCYAL